MRVIVPDLPVERFSVFCCKKASKLVKYFFHYFLFYFPISNFFSKVDRVQMDRLFLYYWDN